MFDGMMETLDPAVLLFLLIIRLPSETYLLDQVQTLSVVHPVDVDPGQALPADKVGELVSETLQERRYIHLCGCFHPPDYVEIKSLNVHGSPGSFIMSRSRENESTRIVTTSNERYIKLNV